MNSTTPAESLAKFKAETEATKQLLAKIAGISITHAVDPESWEELLEDAREDLIDLVSTVAQESAYGGLTSSNAQLRIVQQTLRIDFLEHFTFILNHTLTEGN